jgi:hypothetical protein
MQKKALISAFFITPLFYEVAVSATGYGATPAVE